MLREKPGRVGVACFVKRSRSYNVLNFVEYQTTFIDKKIYTDEIRRFFKNGQYFFNRAFNIAVG